MKVTLPNSLVNHTQLEVKDDMSGAVTGLAMAQLFWLEYVPTYKPVLGGLADHMRIWAFHCSNKILEVPSN